MTYRLDDGRRVGDRADAITAAKVLAERERRPVVLTAPDGTTSTYGGSPERPSGGAQSHEALAARWTRAHEAQEAAEAEAERWRIEADAALAEWRELGTGAEIAEAAGLSRRELLRRVARHHQREERT